MRYRVQFEGVIGNYSNWYTFYDGYRYFKKWAVVMAYDKYRYLEKDYPHVRGVRVWDSKKKIEVMRLTYPEPSATIDS